MSFIQIEKSTKITVAVNATDVENTTITVIFVIVIDTGSTTITKDVITKDITTNVTGKNIIIVRNDGDIPIDVKRNSVTAVTDFIN
ncbi:hypothetical protein [Oceanobacillus sp. CFH 90083]|uniref:hypothetical protein n=1 Tax=Oceanobacillus sp. CFH 90083 TaxID=2592336 RepID=UPI00128D9DC9|nr:hypothetical protein [Oceanobacillus sp. CFH 90083]